MTPHMEVRPVARPEARSRLRAVATLALAWALASAAPAAAGLAGLGAADEAAHRALREHPVRTLEGRSLTLGAQAGQVVVVNFWASWCAPCRRELPKLADLNRRLAGRGARVVAVSIDRDPANAKRFLRAQGIAVPAACDGPDGLARSLDLRAVPLTLVIGRDGRIAWSTTRSDDAGLAELTRVTEQLLAGGAAAASTGGAQ